MFHVLVGTDRDALRGMLNVLVASGPEGSDVLRVTDAHTVEDLAASLQGAGLFGGTRTVVLEYVLQNEEMRPIVLEHIPSFSDSTDTYILLEESIDAQTKRKIEKHAQTYEKRDGVKAPRDTAVFNLGYALERGDKKALWVGYMQELGKGNAPEMIHGILFWSVKQSFLKSGDARSRSRVAELAALPHDARRKGVELEYALENYILSRV